MSKHGKRVNKKQVIVRIVAISLAGLMLLSTLGALLLR